MAVCLVVQCRRNAAALRELLGEKPKGVVVSDRFGAYNFLPDGRRQFCWAHLKRDFQAMAERAGEAKAVGEGLLLGGQEPVPVLAAVPGGQGRPGLVPTAGETASPPRRGGAAVARAGKRLRQDGRDVLQLLEGDEALWTFARVEGVEPTNNAAERALRTAVIWRKK